MLPAFLWSSIKNKSGIWGGILQPNHHGKELQPVFIAPGDVQRKEPLGRDTFAEIWPVSLGSARIAQTFC